MYQIFVCFFQYKYLFNLHKLYQVFVLKKFVCNPGTLSAECCTFCTPEQKSEKLYIQELKQKLKLFKLGAALAFE